MGNRYFVTGGTGFIGAYTVRQLVRQGGEVCVYDIRPDVEFLKELLTEQELGRVIVTAGDVTDMPQLLRAIVEFRPSRIIHLAALLGSKSEDNPYLSLRVNCESNLHIFEIALATGVERVVWGSSAAVFGPTSKRPPGIVANDAMHNPLGLYGACKSLTEHFSTYYRRTRGLDAVGLRFTLVYGYGKVRTIARGTGADYLMDLIDNPAAGRPGKIPAGDAIMDLLYVEDAARAVVMAVEARKTKSAALTVGGFRVSLRDAAALVRDIVPTAELTVEDGSWRGTLMDFDKSTTLAEIGYQPDIEVSEGLRRNIRELQLRQKN